MSEPTTNEQMPGTRREFVKGVGAGALGLSMMGGAKLLGADRGRVERGDLLDDEPSPAGGPCDLIQLAVDRGARSTAPPLNLSCVACTCATPPVQAWTESRHKFRTSFETDPTLFCDELAQISVSSTAELIWLLKPRRVREFGPCQTPIGTLDGRFLVRDVDSSGVTVNLFKGRVYGTVGIETCGAPADPACCKYPLVTGMLIGKGLPGTTAAGCITRWSFCGVEVVVPGTICDLVEWDVRVTGVTLCPCI